MLSHLQPSPSTCLYAVRAGPCLSGGGKVLAGTTISASSSSSLPVDHITSPQHPLSQNVHKRYPHSQGYRTHRLFRYSGIRPVRCKPPRSDWQIAREKEFLASRARVPGRRGSSIVETGQDQDGRNASDIPYIKELTEDDVTPLPQAVKNLLKLDCANGREVHQYRKRLLIKKFQVSPFDTNSPAVRIACLTEKILNLRAHLIKTVKDIPGRRVMSMLLSKRMRVMRNLYKTDFLLYKHVCEELGLRMVRFAVPEFRDPSKMVSPMAVDGDKMKWLIRQKLYKKKNMPMMFMDATRTFTGRRASTLVRHTRHPLEPVPEDHGKPKATVQQLSPHFPYGVRADRVRGEQVVHNPTAPGPGYCVGRMK